LTSQQPSIPNGKIPFIFHPFDVSFAFVSHRFNTNFMLSPEVVNILNNQTSVEADASHAYLALASWCEERNLPGIAEYFYAASEDERSHYLELVKYINLHQAPAVIHAVKQPRSSFVNLLEVFQYVWDLEHNNTLNISNVAEVCLKQKDFATYKFMEAFILEQQNAEKDVEDLIHMIKTLGHDDKSLYYINKNFKKLIDKASQAGAAG
jgi:ferritin